MTVDEAIDVLDEFIFRVKHFNTQEIEATKVLLAAYKELAIKSVKRQKEFITGPMDDFLIENRDEVIKVMQEELQRLQQQE